MIIRSRSIVCASGVRFSVKRRIGNRHKRKNKILLALGYDSYSEYLSGMAWQAIRLAKLSVDQECEICCLAVATSVHHMLYDYDTLTGRNARGLVSICDQCHRNIEFTSSGKKRPLKVTRNITEKLLAKSGRLVKHLTKRQQTSL